MEMTMSTHIPRLNDAFKLAPETIKGLLAASNALKASGLEPALLELVKIRASQINGCAFCLHMHVTDARKMGETEMRLHLLNAWRDSSLYTDRERAALAWTEALTRVADTGAPDEDYALVQANFTEAEQVQLSLAIGIINLWNRLQVGFRAAHPPVAHIQGAAA
ncbi:alkylhydroperoxidase [Nitrospirillum viridazoti CBAmc]|uniref:Alkylhydroperoxidase n=2 Tax=Nitrospirillum TaxID=1543705 RepID=A0A248JZI4_9PROT|nr:alkylhydroperoxidase [Nitrospirillum amazonense CBAmc]